MFLLDTNIISLLAPTKRRTAADQAIASWIVERSEDLWLSVITAAEVQDGISNATRRGATRKAHDLQEWWGEIEHYYEKRLLPFDLATARIAGQYMTLARSAGISPGFEDIAIAATAKQHDLEILTINEKDFKPLGVRFRNPLKADLAKSPRR